MTYKFGVLGREVGGAKGAVRGELDRKSELMAKYCEEIRPLVESFEFLTGPDLGTSESDFAILRANRTELSLMSTSVGGVPMEDLVTGFGVTAAAEAAMVSLDGMAVAIEGFGKVGGGVAREAVRRGAKVAAISTLSGCAFDPNGLDVELMLAMRREYGDDVVKHVGKTFDEDPSALFDVDADILVPGARTGVISADVAKRLKTRWIIPAANVPYTADAVPVMRERRIRYLPDFVCNAGAVIGYTSNASTSAELFDRVGRVITDLMSRAQAHPTGPYEGACAIAEAFIESWRGPDGLPGGPPLA